MGSGALVIFFVAQAVGTAILAFPIAALVVKSRRSSRLGWGRGFALFGICVLLLAAFFAARAAGGDLRPASDISLSTLAMDYLVPLGVCLGVLWVGWKRGAPDESPRDR